MAVKTIKNEGVKSKVIQLGHTFDFLPTIVFINSNGGQLGILVPRKTSYASGHGAILSLASPTKLSVKYSGTKVYWYNDLSSYAYQQLNAEEKHYYIALG